MREEHGPSAPGQSAGETHSGGVTIPEDEDAEEDSPALVDASAELPPSPPHPPRPPVPVLADASPPEPDADALELVAPPVPLEDAEAAPPTPPVSRGDADT